MRFGFEGFVFRHFFHATVLLAKLALLVLLLNELGGSAIFLRGVVVAVFNKAI